MSESSASRQKRKNRKALRVASEKTLRGYNEDVLYLWLSAYSGGLSRINPQDDNPMPKKLRRGSKSPVGMLWLEALSDPAVRETCALLQEIVFDRMPRTKTGTLCFRILSRVYLAGDSNIAEPERWRLSERLLDSQFLEIYEEAIKFVLDEVGDRVLAYPDPDYPQDFVEESRHRQQVAKRVFYSVLEETLSEDTARRRAAERSGYSIKHMYRLVGGDHLSGFKEVKIKGTVLNAEGEREPFECAEKVKGGHAEGRVWGMRGDFIQTPYELRRLAARTAQTLAKRNEMDRKAAAKGRTPGASSHPKKEKIEKKVDNLSQSLV